jgi:small subunit ribosomal protein S10e
MYIPTKNRKLIYQYLFNKGVVVVRKDYNLAKNPDIPVSNLEVIKALKSLVSRNLVVEEFNWQIYYFFLKEEGIAYLRSYLNIPEGVVPDTVAKATVPAARAPRSEEASARGGPRQNKVGHEGSFKPRFEGRPRN